MQTLLTDSAGVDMVIERLLPISWVGGGGCAGSSSSADPWSLAFDSGAW